jgi:hypothetical protein
MDLKMAWRMAENSAAQWESWWVKRREGQRVVWMVD